MGVVEVVFKYVDFSDRRTSFSGGYTSFSVSKVYGVEVCPPEGEPKYLFPREASLRHSIRKSSIETYQGKKIKFSIDVYIISEGSLVIVDYSSTGKRKRYREYALLLVRNGSESQLNGVYVSNAEKIYSMHDEQLTLIAHKGLVERGYLISSSKPYSNVIAFYAEQILTRTVNIPHVPEQKEQTPEQKTDEISGRLKTLIDSL